MQMTRTLTTTLFALLGMHATHLAAADLPELQSTKLFRIETSGGVGYIDASGAIVIAPRFFEAFHFSEGLALASLDGKKYGHIDPTGQFAIPPQFDLATSFHEGRAGVCLDGKWGFIDRNGATIVPTIFDHTDDFEDGVALVGSLPAGSGKFARYLQDIRRYRWTYIDHDGVEIGDPKFQENGSNELLPLRSGSKLGYINSRGEMVITPRFEIASRFREGLACIAEDEEIGYIGADGAYAIEPQFAVGSDFQDGVAIVARSTPTGLAYGLIDRAGKPILPFIYRELSRACEELFAFRTHQGGKVGYLTKDGVVRIEPQYDHGFPFMNGVAEVSIARRQCCIDSSGKIVWDGRLASPRSRFRR